MINAAVVLTGRDVLNRYPYDACNSSNDIQHAKSKGQSGKEPPKHQSSTVHVLMYMFPRQFGLHNAFTSVVDSRETVQPFKDYTLREDEIRDLYPKHKDGSGIKIPKRLKAAASLVRKLQVLHQRCPYDEILKHYCSHLVRIASVERHTRINFLNRDLQHFRFCLQSHHRTYHPIFKRRNQCKRVFPRLNRLL